jgi:hypothetical protein
LRQVFEPKGSINEPLQGFGVPLNADIHGMKGERRLNHCIFHYHTCPLPIFYECPNSQTAIMSTKKYVKEDKYNASPSPTSTIFPRTMMQVELHTFAVSILSDQPDSLFKINHRPKQSMPLFSLLPLTIVPHKLQN